MRQIAHIDIDIVIHFEKKVKCLTISVQPVYETDHF